MSTRLCRSVGALVLALVAHTVPLLCTADSSRADEFLGACSLHFGEVLECIGETTESECRERCDYLLCDQSRWLERRPQISPPGPSKPAYNAGSTMLRLSHSKETG